MKPNYTNITDFPGRFIILEWPDGSGKSTQAKKLKKKLKEHGEKAVIITWKDAPHFRDFFAEHDKRSDQGVSSEAHLLLQVADMLYQVEKKVIPHLMKGHTVIMDRAVPTIVIRGLTLGHTLQQLEKGMLWFTKTIYRPLFEKAIIVFLSVSARRSLERIMRRGEKEGDIGEGTLLSLQMINNLRYMPDGAKLTKGAKRRLVEKLQETYITSYRSYFTHHAGITIDANRGKDDVFRDIYHVLYPEENTRFVRQRLTRSSLKKSEKILH